MNLTPYGLAMQNMRQWGYADYRENKSMCPAFDLRLGQSAKARAFPIRARAAYQMGWEAKRDEIRATTRKEG